MNDIVERALRFASEAHEGQKRRYTGEPYIVHPVEVMEMVSAVCDDSEVLASALLHDVVEDTSFSLEDIRELFGDRVASLVDQLTDQSKIEDGTRKTRKEIDRQHAAKATPEAQTVKLADLISNSRCIIKNDPKFAKVYMVEKLRLLDVLDRGNELLFEEARRLVEEYYESRRSG